MSRVLGIDVGTEFDTIPINKKTNRYDIDIWYVEAFVQYTGMPGDEQNTFDMKYRNFDISINRNFR